MTYLLVRNTVKDFATFKAVFDADLARGAEYGLKPAGMWRRVEDRNDVWFMLEVESVDRAMAFMNSPESAESGEAAGVIDGEYHFVEDTGA